MSLWREIRGATAGEGQDNILSLRIRRVKQAQEIVVYLECLARCGMVKMPISKMKISAPVNSKAIPFIIHLLCFKSMRDVVVSLASLPGEDPRDKREDDQESKNNVQEVDPFHHSSPRSINRPISTRTTKDTSPVTNRASLNPDINGPMINVATQILLVSKTVLARFSRWRFVNFIKENISTLERLVKWNILIVGTRNDWMASQ